MKTTSLAPGGPGDRLRASNRLPMNPRPSSPPLSRRGFLTLTLGSIPCAVFAQQTGSSDRIGTSPTVLPVRAGEGRSGHSRKTPTGSSCFKVGTADAGGGLFVMEHRNLKKGGPPLHLHHGEDEWFYVLEGEYLLQLGTVIHRMKSGDSILGEREIPHTWAFVGETPGRLLIAYAPAGKMEAFFGERDKHGGNYVTAADQMRAYGMELLGPPLAVG